MSANKEESPKELALKSVPTGWRERLISEASHVGCKADDDVLWTVIASVINAWASAGAAGAAAQVVTASIQKIPEMIYQGATAAGYDINLEFKKRFEGYGQTLIVAVDQARDKAKSQIQQTIVNTGNSAISGIEQAGQSVKDSTKNLENMLNGVIEQKAKEGVVQWAEAARVAGQASALAASRQIYSKATMIMGGALLAALLAGAGLVFYGEGIDDQIAPLPIKIVSGQQQCWSAQGKHGLEAFCQLTGTDKQKKALN